MRERERSIFFQIELSTFLSRRQSIKITWSPDDGKSFYLNFNLTVIILTQFQLDHENYNNQDLRIRVCSIDSLFIQENT
ncbi:hypothetical protein BpHYR1_035883 [Brachionus plicatilis]|uniref:Uncharacterized protein n=1 Tax=Brachionus plicatilis TaxID=10195 RepID=A0A3M7QUJ0_BRAPC|nr:hypothetical protein BpHYR1_035883 [Brachionus plicatilis]